ncbi:MAG: flagellar hook-associated protein FlgK, partial [Tissierellia bacterium]|nr:flagellar hook-associated protein FlgK [Tissierellia bacterium]
FNSSPDDFIKSIMSNYAVDSIQSKRMYETQNLILKNIESKRNSISGVSYDEEMANMVKFQQAYIASARMINTLDEIIGLTVNNLGLVGR